MKSDQIIDIFKTSSKFISAFNKDFKSMFEKISEKQDKINSQIFKEIAHIDFSYKIDSLIFKEKAHIDFL